GYTANNGLRWYSSGNASGYNGWVAKAFVGNITGSYTTAPLVFTTPDVSGNPLTTLAMVNGNVGIGTVSPDAPLNIGGAGTGTINDLRFTTGSTDYWSLGFLGDGTNNFYVKNQHLGKRAILASDGASTPDINLVPDGGSVGIGNTPPVVTLHVMGNEGIYSS